MARHSLRHLPAQREPPEELSERQLRLPRTHVPHLALAPAPEEMRGAAAAVALSDRAPQRRWLLRPATLTYRRRHVGG